MQAPLQAVQEPKLQIRVMSCKNIFCIFCIFQYIMPDVSVLAKCNPCDLWVPHLQGDDLPVKTPRFFRGAGKGHHPLKNNTPRYDTTDHELSLDCHIVHVLQQYQTKSAIVMLKKRHTKSLCMCYHSKSMHISLRLALH